MVGLGNPGEEYEHTRHNVGRTIVEKFVDVNDGTPWKKDAGSNSLLSQVKIGSHTIIAALPDTFMNKSGLAVGYLTKSKTVPPQRIIVVQDDLDLPLGGLKLSFARGSGGHKGIESVERALKTNEYLRIRVGVSGETPSGKIKKPKGDEKVLKHVIGDFKKTEESDLKKVIKKSVEAIQTIVEEGRGVAMNRFN